MNLHTKFGRALTTILLSLPFSVHATISIDPNLDSFDDWDVGIGTGVVFLYDRQLYITGDPDVIEVIGQRVSGGLDPHTRQAWAQYWSDVAMENLQETLNRIENWTNAEIEGFEAPSRWQVDEERKKCLLESLDAFHGCTVDNFNAYGRCINALGTTQTITGSVIDFFNIPLDISGGLEIGVMTCEGGRFVADQQCEKNKLAQDLACPGG